MTVAFFVAACLVTTLQFIRVRERRLLPLLALFALAAVGHSREDPRAGRWYFVGAGAAGLALVVMLSPRHPPHHG
ncbi:MAG TPA: hypothetical protein VFO85_16910 [Vicinamibacteria bacterium]|nr:hypothetical protein [Vicinamibacteria bacterium]